jgi:SWI/SNF-related matrix-associated actin-dependent regulator of chromatin subfamily A3
MTVRKRHIDAIDLTQDEGSSRPAKVGRSPQPGLSGNNMNAGQRFGQDTAFVPLSQADSIRFSQLDDDDADADDLVQSTQNADDFNSISDSEFLSKSSITVIAIVTLAD